MPSKKQLFSILLFASLILTSINAQNLQLSFTGSGLSTTIDSVQVLNIAQGTSVTVKSTEGLQLVGNSTDVVTHLHGKGNLMIFPNPMTETSGIEFFNVRESPVNIEVFDVTGKIVILDKQHLIQGNHKFEISGLNPGIYLVNVLTFDERYVGKLLSNGANSGTPAIRYLGENYASAQKSVLKSTQNSVQMQYNDGERLLFKGISGNYSRVLTLIPTQNQTLNFVFIACTDADGNHYPVVTIGTQTWMAENLAFLPSVSPSSQGSLTTPYYYVYAYNGTNVNEAKATSNYQNYGVLYNWPAALQACPVGWHLPTDGEWKTLEMHLGLSQAQADTEGYRGTMGVKLKETGTTHWTSPNTGATNESGFTARQGIGRTGHGTFAYVGSGRWWSATSAEEIPNDAWIRILYYNLDSVGRTIYYKANGFSVRCLRD